MVKNLEMILCIFSKLCTLRALFMLCVFYARCNACFMRVVMRFMRVIRFMHDMRSMHGLVDFHNLVDLFAHKNSAELVLTG